MSKSNDYSRVIAGTMTWGRWGKQLSKSEMTKLMNQCVEMGITTFDHADIYGGYENETDFGAAFFESGIPRERIQLISKCGIQMIQGRNNKVKHYQYDANYIVWSAEQSLNKLKTEYLDLFLLHRPSPLMVPDEVAKAVEKLKKDGKINKFGVSNFTPSQIALLETAVDVEGNQVEYSLTHVEPMEDGTFDDCISNNRMAMAWSPLGSFFRDGNEQKRRISEALKGLVKKYNADESQLLLAFILKHPVGVRPVVGTTNKDRLSASLEAAQLDMELQDWFVLLEASQGSEVP
ncbi:MAG: aldo/keto reductase [Bacteroidota bacterium]